MFVIAISVACSAGLPTQVPNTISETPGAPTPSPIIIPTPPQGWTPYSRSTYQIALPDSWQEIKLSDAQLKGAIATAQENNPPLAEQLRALLESGQYKSFVFYAVEKNSAVPRNVSIARVALAGTNDLQAYAKTYAEQLPNVVRGAKVIEVQAPIQVNGMRAAEVTYDISLMDETSNLMTLRGVQYLYVLETGDAYLVTVTGGGDDPEKFTALARAIATSFVAVTP